LETAGVILILISVLWLKFPLVRGTSTPVDLLELFLAALFCTACCYFVSVLLATFLDDAWQIWGSILVIGLAWGAVAKLSLPPSADIFRFMGDASPLITHRMPWTAMGISILASAALFFASLKIVQTREY
jgi:hypothetical protein